MMNVCMYMYVRMWKYYNLPIFEKLDALVNIGKESLSLLQILLLIKMATMVRWYRSR